GIVDQNVDAFEIGFGLLAERLDLVPVRQIGRENFHPVTELAGQSLQLFYPSSEQANRRAPRMQGARDRLAYAACCAGNNRLAAIEIKRRVHCGKEMGWERALSLSRKGRPAQPRHRWQSRRCRLRCRG